MLETSQPNSSFILPTPQGGEVELSREHYAVLVGAGELSPRRLSTITAAALILDYVSHDDPLSLKEVVARIYGTAEVKPSSTERRAMVALDKAGLVHQVGAGAATRYASSVQDGNDEEV